MSKKTEKLKAKEVKAQTLKDLTEKVARAKTLTFTDYHGLTVNQISGIRDKVKQAGGEVIVAKNTLMKRALTSNQLPVTSDQLAGPTAAIFAYGDEIAPIKSVADSIKILGLPKFKFGFFGKTQLDIAGVESLAKIPAREVLHGQVVGVLLSPIYGFVSVLEANIRNLVSIFDQIAKKQN